MGGTVARQNRVTEGVGMVPGGHMKNSFNRHLNKGKFKESFFNPMSLKEKNKN